MLQFLNLNTRNFQIPERRGTNIYMQKRFSNLQDTILPSETDMKVMNDTMSKFPKSDMIEINSKQEMAITINLNEENKSKTKTSSSSSDESASKTSVSCKFVININNNYPEESERSKSKHLSIDENSEIAPEEDLKSKRSAAIPSMKINIHPDLSSQRAFDESFHSSDITSNSSISSLVSKKSDFLKKSENHENLKHRRRSNITYNQAMDPEIQEDTKHKRRHSKKMIVKKSTQKLFPLKRTKSRESKHLNFKKVKSSYRSLFRTKK